MIQRLWFRSAVGSRLLASLLLVTVPAGFASTILAHEDASSPDCHQLIGTGTAAFLPQSSLECDHTPGSACAMMLGCASVAPALVSVHVQAIAHAAVTMVASVGASTDHGRLVLGPPTPPPNS